MYYKLFHNMSQNNSHHKRKFIPQSIGDTIKKINRNFTTRFGKIEFIIISKWPEIAGPYFSEYSDPKNITRVPDYKNDIGETVYRNLLNVSVTPAAAVEFQHFKDTILEKINSYFGYKAIVDLRIQQNYILKNEVNKLQKNERNLTENENNYIHDEVKNLNNKDLQRTLFKLGKNILKEPG